MYSPIGPLEPWGARIQHLCYASFPFSLCLCQKCLVMSCIRFGLCPFFCNFPFQPNNKSWISYMYIIRFFFTKIKSRKYVIGHIPRGSRQFYGPNNGTSSYLMSVVRCVETGLYRSFIACIINAQRRHGNDDPRISWQEYMIAHKCFKLEYRYTIDKYCSTHKRGFCNQT